MAKMPLKLIYLIGVDHRIQWEPTVDFVNFLSGVCTKYNIQLLAEEFNQELVTQNGVQESTLECLARHLDLPHLFCEPDSNESIKLGIGKNDPDRKDKRELEWLNRLEPRKEERILFLCGNNHPSSFSEKLIGKGFQSEILATDRGSDWRFREDLFCD